MFLTVNGLIFKPKSLRFLAISFRDLFVVDISYLEYPNQFTLTDDKYNTYVFFEVYEYLRDDYGVNNYTIKRSDYQWQLNCALQNILS